MYSRLLSSFVFSLDWSVELLLFPVGCFMSVPFCVGVFFCACSRCLAFVRALPARHSRSCVLSLFPIEPGLMVRAATLGLDVAPVSTAVSTGYCL